MINLSKSAENITGAIADDKVRSGRYSIKLIVTTACLAALYVTFKATNHYFDMLESTTGLEDDNIVSEVL